MKRFRWLPVVVAGVVLAGCTPSISPEEEVVQHSEEQVETTIIPNIQLSENYYRTLVPYKESASRGLVVSNVYTKYDVKEVENGLMRISHQEFNTEDYYFQEGQYLSKEMVTNWLGRSNQTDNAVKKYGESYRGLNPSDVDAAGNKLTPEVKAVEAPVYLAHIVEQNYLTKTEENKVTLGGISLGLALNSTYYYQKELYGEYYEEPIPDAKLEAEAKKIAQEIVNRMRQRSELADVPITIGLFKQEARNSIVPGTYFMHTTIDKGSSSIGEWTSIDEKYVTLPMSSPEDIYRDLNDKFLKFKQDIDEYFANFTSVVGQGFYQDKGLSKLSIEIPIQFYGTAEIIGFTQYLTGVMLQHLPNNVQITISITSANGPEALIQKEPDSQEPFVHIYD